MRKFFLLCCALFLMSFSIPAYAAAPISLTAIDGYELGVQVSSYKYEEEVDGAFFMSTEGTKIGLVGKATTTLVDNSYLVTDWRIAFGDVDYKGSGTKKDNPEHLYELRVTGGYDYEKEGYLLSPYIGLGLRFLGNDFRGTTSTNAHGYRRDSTYWYIPVGVTHRFRSGPNARISTSLEYDYLIRGTQKTYLSDLDPLYGDPVNEQKNGYGLRLSSAHETEKFSVGIFYNYWNIGDSEVSEVTYVGVPIGTGIEPKNKTNEFGVQLLRRF